MMYGAESWLVKNSHVLEIRVEKMRVLRSMCKRDKNGDIHHKVRVTFVVDKTSDMRKMVMTWEEEGDRGPVRKQSLYLHEVG